MRVNGDNQRKRGKSARGGRSAKRAVWVIGLIPCAAERSSNSSFVLGRPKGDDM